MMTWVKVLDTICQYSVRFTRILALLLIEHIDVTHIYIDHPNVVRKRLELILRMWYAHEPNKSWKILRSVLMFVKQYSVIKKIETEGKMQDIIPFPFRFTLTDILVQSLLPESDLSRISSLMANLIIRI